MAPDIIKGLGKMKVKKTKFMTTKITEQFGILTSIFL